MPRTRRAAAPTDAPTEGATVETPTPQTAASDTSQAQTSAATPDAAPAAEATPKTRRRRTTPTPVPTEIAASPDTEAPVTPTDIGPEPAPKRRGGRRKSAETPAETAIPDPAPVAEAAPVTETASPPEAAPEESTRRRRGRTRKADPVEAPIDAVADGAPVVDIPSVGEQNGQSPEAATDAPEPTKRRPGGRRRAAPPVVTAELPDVEAPVAEETSVAAPAAAEPDAPATRRRRSRRRGEPVSPEMEAPTDTSVEAETSPAAETEEAAGEPAEEEGSRRGRRRRSRRKRAGDLDAAVDLVDTAEEGLILPEPVNIPDEDEEIEDLSALTLIAPPPPVYVAPPLVPPVLPPAGGALLPRVRAQVRPAQDGGLAQIVVEEQTFPPFLFFVNAETASNGEVVDSQIREAAAAGIHLYSGVMYLPLRNAYGDRSFGATDALLQQILSADPDAYLLPRLQFVPTNYWARTHADQMASYADGGEGDVSLASTEFWADCVDALEALIAHLSDPATPGGERVIGFHLDRGEWFYDASAGYDLSEPNRTAFQNWLHAKYQFPYALRAAWYDASVTFDDAEIPAWPGAASKTGDQPLYASPRDGRWPDFAQFASDLVADAITGLASAVKTLSEGRLLVAVSYGYTLEFATRNDSGHLALGKVLESPDIDILAGPNSYTGRGAGSSAAFGAPIDSVALHGKLWLVEDDTKTFLAAEETPDTYNPKIAGAAETQAAHERHFGAALAHRAGVTWMDLWGQGWLDSPDIWRELGRLRDQADHLGQIAPQAGAAHDVIMFVDEASLAFLKNNPTGLGQHLVGKTRDLLLRSGASVGFYLQSDVRRDNLPDAKLYLFAAPLRLTTPERQAIRERLHRPGKTLAWLYAPGVFDEHGLAEQEVGDTVGMALRLQPWNSRLGSQLTDINSPVTERLRGGKRGIGQEEVVNPSYAVSDPQASVLAEYVSTGAASLAVREQPGGWKSVFIGDPHLTVELLRGLYAYAGVPVYETQDDVVYAGEGVLLVHAPYTGQRTLNLPRRATVYDVTEDRIVAADTKSFRAFLRARTTRLFLWGDAEAITAATGQPLPAPGPRESSPPPPRRETPPASETPPRAETAPNQRGPGVLSDTLADDLAFALDAIEDAVRPILGGEEEASDEGSADSEATPAPRSRWQRRRAALRARREAERQARAEAGTADGGRAADAPVDLATLLPDLPPRRVEGEATRGEVSGNSAED